MGRILVVLHNSPRFLKTPKTSFLDQQAKILDNFRFHANSSTRECILRCSRDSIRKNEKKNIFVVVLTPKRSVLQNSPPSPNIGTIDFYYSLPTLRQSLDSTSKKAWSIDEMKLSTIFRTSTSF